jgi:lipoyl(octanoyl) transferase
MRSARLLLDPPASGSWNMAVDQALLESVARTGQMALRFYRWVQPTLSLGYFQSLRDRSLHPASRECPIVRRSTGGGAILHDQEITYSLCVPSSNRWAEAHEQLYWTVHGCIVEALSDWGIEAKLCRTLQKTLDGPLENHKLDSPTGAGVQTNVTSFQPFLCFQRRSQGDIVYRADKICGSAQRRNQRSILQHGSLIFCQSKFAPELPGIDDLSGRPPINQNQYLERLFERLGEVLRVELVTSELDNLERSQAMEFEPVFRSQNWLDKLVRLKSSGAD